MVGKRTKTRSSFLATIVQKSCVASIYDSGLSMPKPLPQVSVTYLCLWLGA